MQDERINTNFELPEKGIKNLYVESLIKSVSKNNPSVYFYKLTVTPENEGDKTFTVIYFKSQMAELLRALGAKESSPGIFEKGDFRGKWITADITHEKDKQDIDRARLTNIKTYTINNAQNSTNQKQQKSEEWDEKEGPNL